MPCTSATTSSRQRPIEWSSRGARQEERILVSADTDFATALARTAGVAPSVIVFRRGSGRRAAQQLALLEANLPDLEEPLAGGCVGAIEATRVRVRSLPISGLPE